MSVSPPGPSGALTRSVVSAPGTTAISSGGSDSAAPRPTSSFGSDSLAPSGAPSPTPQGRPGPPPEARNPHVLDVSGPGALGGDFQLPRIEADVGTLLDLIEDGNLRMGVGLRPGARLGLGVRVPQSESSSSRPDLGSTQDFESSRGDGSPTPDDPQINPGSATTHRANALSSHSPMPKVARPSSTAPSSSIPSGSTSKSVTGRVGFLPTCSVSRTPTSRAC